MKNMPKIKIIINPISGRGAGAQNINIVEQILRSDNIEYEVEYTQHPLHAISLSKQSVLDGFKIIIAMGGDGTSNEVLNGIMLAKQEQNSNVSMGIIPVGRGNDFSYGVGIPNDVEAACRIISTNHRKTIDIGFVKGGLYPDGRYFGNGVGIGFDAVVGLEALKMKHLHGFASYLVAALKTIFLYYQAPQVLIEWDSQKLNISTLMISIMNGRRMGGGFLMAPHAKMDDGFFNLCIANQVNKAQILALIPRFLQGTQSSHPSIQTGQAQKIKVTAINGILPAHADGETICTDGTQLELEILEHNLEIISKITV